MDDRELFQHLNEIKMMCFEIGKKVGAIQEKQITEESDKNDG